MSILGTYWCENDKLWVRFIEENKIVRAEIAEISNDPRVTKGWVEITKGFWQVNYADNSERPYIACFHFDKGSFFKRDDINHGFMATSERRNGNWYPPKFDPFPQNISDDFNSRPYNKLPLTPEMYSAKIKREQEAQQLKIKQDEERWQKFQGSDLHRDGMNVAFFNSFFPEHMEGLLLDLLKSELFELNPKAYSFTDYINVLKTIVEDDTNNLHQKIIALAATTDLDKELSVDLTRVELYEAKKSLYFNVLREEALFLAQAFGIKCEILAVQDIGKKNSSNQSGWTQQNDFNDYQGFNFDNDYQPNQGFDYQFDYPRGDLEEGDGGFQQAIVASLQGSINNQNHFDDSEIEGIMQESENEFVMLDLIKIAVSNAQEKYKKWYGGENLRGDKGCFTFFRHGKDGQIRAVELKNQILNMSEKFDAVAEINKHLRSDDTKYHRHSFASFLLDELKSIPGSPWQGIAYIPESNLYDKKLVISHIDSPPVNNFNNII